MSSTASLNFGRPQNGVLGNGLNCPCISRLPIDLRFTEIPKYDKN